MKALAIIAALVICDAGPALACGMSPAPTPTPNVVVTVTNNNNNTAQAGAWAAAQASANASALATARALASSGTTNYVPVGPALIEGSCTSPSLTPYAQGSNGYGYTTTTLGVSANIPLGGGYRACMDAAQQLLLSRTIADCVAYQHAGVLLDSPIFHHRCDGLNFLPPALSSPATVVAPTPTPVVLTRVVSVLGPVRRPACAAITPHRRAILLSKTNPNGIYKLSRSYKHAQLKAAMDEANAACVDYSRALDGP